MSVAIHEMLNSFKKLDREIEVLTHFIVALIGCILFRMAWLVYQLDTDSVWSSIAVLGALLSALLISKSASRLIVHNQLNQEQTRREEVVRLTHHAMAVVTNLTDLVGYVRGCLDDVEKPAIAFLGAAKEIEEKWSLFYDRELNQLLTPEAYSLVRSMSASFFGLTSLGRGLAASLPQEQLMKPLPTSQMKSAFGKNLDLLHGELGTFYDELTKIREMVE